MTSMPREALNQNIKQLIFIRITEIVEEIGRWWARQDSNLQPDRYERPALTIELQAPPRRPI